MPEYKLLLPCQHCHGVIFIDPKHSVKAVPAANEKLPLPEEINHEVAEPHGILAKVVLSQEPTLPAVVIELSFFQAKRIRIVEHVAIRLASYRVCCEVLGEKLRKLL